MRALSFGLPTCGEIRHISAQTIQRYETGNIQIPTEAVAKCAKALHTPVGYFYGEEDQQPANNNTNRVGLMVAAEVMALADDNIRKSVYHLVRSINRHGQSQDNDNSQS